MEKRAFLFGINEYNSLSKLKYARQDAEAVARELQVRYGFRENDIKLRTCASSGEKPTIKSDITQFLKKSKTPIDLLIFGFFGHGVIHNGKRYLCPSSTRIEEIETNALSLDELKDCLKEMNAKNIWIILDCCQNNIEGGRDAGSATMATKDAENFQDLARDIQMNIRNRDSRNQRKENDGATVIVFNSCSEGERAYEWDDKEHGYFTWYLLDAFQQNLASVSQIYDRIKKELPKSNIRQHPFWASEGNDIKLPVVKSEKGKEAPPPTPFVPNPDEVQIQRFDVQISPLSTGKTSLYASQGATPHSGAKGISWPSLPKSMARIPAQINDINATLDALRNRTHPDLTPAKEQIEAARAQSKTIKGKKDEAWKKISFDLRKILDSKVQEHPSDRELALDIVQHRPQNFTQSDFNRIVRWGQKAAEAQLEAKRVEDEVNKKIDSQIAVLEKKREELHREYNRTRDQFRETVFSVLFRNCPGFSDAQAPFPTDELTDWLPLMPQYNIGWSEDDLWSAARQSWKSNRPVIVRKAFVKKLIITTELIGGILLVMAMVFWLEGAEDRRIAAERQAEQARKDQQAVPEAVEGTPLEVPAPAAPVEWVSSGRAAGERLVVTINGVEYAFRWCPAGEFMMGSPSGESRRTGDEKQHRVRLTQGFWMLE
ncbi:MAG: caspase family protein, partial [Planctomycetia bacterium]|nr:caspase family protein [Planctomycetia bacterium]